MQSSKWVEFKAVKSAITMEMVLQHYGVNWLRKKRDVLIGCCPIHGGDNPNAFHVSRSKNIWQCFTGCCCGGNVLDFVVAMEGLSRDSNGLHQAGLMLQQWFPPAVRYANVSDGIPASRHAGRMMSSLNNGSSVNPPLSFTLDDLDPSHPYLQQRGIDVCTAEHFGIGYYNRSGIMSGRVVIPIHDHLGRLVAYAGRAVSDLQAFEQGKYRFPAGFRKSLCVYNLNRIIRDGNCSELILVEGFFDVFRLHQLGYPNAVAIMGTTLSQTQELHILDATQNVTLMFDGDPAGRACTQSVERKLAGKLNVKTIILPDGIQPEHLTTPMLQEMLPRAY